MTKMFIFHYLAQKIIRKNIFYHLFEILQNLKTFYGLKQSELKIIYKWNSFFYPRTNNLSNPKKYIIFAPTLDKKKFAFHIGYIFFLKIYQSIGFIPLIINPGIYSSIYKKFGFKTEKHPYFFIDKNDDKKIKNILNKIDTIKKKINLKYYNISCGRFAYAATIRYFKIADLNNNNSKHKKVFDFFINKSMHLVTGYKKIINKYNIQKGIFIDHDSCGEAELFNLLMRENKTALSITSGKDEKSFFLKKYSNKNISDHPRSLSYQTKKIFDQDIISNKKVRKLKREISKLYNKSIWEISSNTQTLSRFFNSKKIKKKFQINNSKPNVVLFSHIFYDTTYSYGNNFFKDYKEWLVKTCESINKNQNINWFIKIHPANIFKNDGKIILNEIDVIKNKIKNLNKNIYFIKPDTKINTLSLIKFLDAAVTVRGTVGIETALFGKQVITGGSGRYSDYGFTKNFKSKSKYLNFLKNLKKNNVKKLNIKQKKIAEKYSYYVFIKREFNPNCKIYEFKKNHKLTPKFCLEPSFYKSKKYKVDSKTLISFIKGKNEDFLN